jgi:hypothetical protein
MSLLEVINIESFANAAADEEVSNMGEKAKVILLAMVTITLV